MHSYQVCDLIFDSEVPFPELRPAAGGRAECGVRFHPVPKARARPVDWIDHRYTPDGLVWLSLGLQGAVHVVRLPGLADFFVSRGGREINAYPASGTSPDAVRRLFLNRVIPLLLSRRSTLVLHAGAVATERGAVAFMGPSGRGKSTLTTHLCSRGLALLSDDYLVVQERAGQLVAFPGHPEVWLRNDTVSALFGREPLPSLVAHHREKTSLSSLDGQLPFHSGSAVLKRIYLLAPAGSGPDGRAVGITPLPPQQAFIALVSNCFKWDITDGETLRKEFARLGPLAGRPLVYRLAYPRDFSLLPAVTGAILEDLRD